MYNDIPFTIVLVTVFTLASVGLAWVLVGKARKVELWRYVVLAIISIAALIAGWMVAQIFIPLSVIAGALLLLAGFRWVIGLSWKKTLIGTGAWVVLWFVLNFVVVLLISTTSTSP